MCYCIGDCSCAKSRYNYMVAAGILDGLPVSIDPPDPERILPKGLVKFAKIEIEEK